MKNKTLFLILLLGMLTTYGWATVLTVSPNPGSAQYTSIQVAQNAATAGDTVVVGPGTYTGGLTINRRINVIGAGWDICTITINSSFCVSFANGSSRTILEGFRIENTSNYGSYIYTGNDSIAIRRCLVVSPGPCIGIETGRLYVEDCILSNTGSGDIISYAIAAASGNTIFRNTVFAHAAPAGFSNSFEGNHGGVIEIYNCVFLNQYQPFALTGIPQVVGINNIFWDWVSSTTFGTLPAGSVFEYTAAGSSPPAFPASFSNNISLGANNPFNNYSNTSNYQIGITNLHLAGAGGTQCTDTGYPSIFDLNASRSDLGIYGGPKPLVDNGVPAYPFALTLNIDNLVEVGDSVSTTSTGRIGPRY